MSYEPRKGSIGERSIAALKIHGKRMSLRDLADEIDADVGAMHASLSLCISHALIVRHQESIGTSYGLPEGHEALDAGPSEIYANGKDEQLPTVVLDQLSAAGFSEVACAAAPSDASETPTSIIEELSPRLPTEADDPSPRPRRFPDFVDQALDRMIDPLPPPSVARHFAVGLFSDGRMVIEVGDRQETLMRDEIEVLWKYVMAIEEPNRV